MLRDGHSSVSPVGIVKATKWRMYISGGESRIRHKASLLLGKRSTCTRQSLIVCLTSKSGCRWLSWHASKTCIETLVPTVFRISVRHRTSLPKRQIGKYVTDWYVIGVEESVGHGEGQTTTTPQLVRVNTCQTNPAKAGTPLAALRTLRYTMMYDCQM